MSIARALLPTSLVAILLGGTTAVRAQAPGARPVTELGRRYPIPPRRLEGAREDGRRQTVSHTVPAVPGAEIRYLRVYMQLEAGERGRWYLTIRDKDLRPVEVLTAASFLPGGGRWTPRVKGTKVLFDLDLVDPAPETTEVRIALKEYIAMPTKAETPYYSSQVPQTPDYHDLFEATDGDKKRMGDTVGFVMSSYDQTSWCCSGVVVGDNLLLTNWHCGGQPGATPAEGYWSPRLCQDTIIDLSWDGDAVSREFRCTEVLCRNRELDFALLRIAPLGTDAAARPATTRRAPPVKDERVVVIHHPECLPKRITDRCSVVDAAYRGWIDATASVDFSHRCDTEAGSSGGAILDAQGRLLGLHHTGFRQTDDHVASERKINTAVRVDRILDFLGSAPGSATCAAGLDGQFKVAP